VVGDAQSLEVSALEGGRDAVLGGEVHERAQVGVRGGEDGELRVDLRQRGVAGRRRAVGCGGQFRLNVCEGTAAGEDLGREACGRQRRQLFGRDDELQCAAGRAIGEDVVAVGLELRGGGLRVG